MRQAVLVADPVERPVASVFRRSWWIAALAWAATLAVTLVATRQQVPVYRASASLVVVPDAQLASAADLLRALETLDRRTMLATLAKLPSTPDARGAAAEAVGLAGREASAYRVSAGVVPNTNIVRIDVEGPDPARAADLSNASAAALGSSTPKLYRTFSVQVIERAVPRRRPIRPDLRRNLVVGAIVGLLAGVAAAAGGDYVRHRTRRR